MIGFWLAVWTLWQRELIRFWRQKSRLLGVIASPLVFWLILGFGAGENAPGFFFPGTVVLTVMFSAVFSTISIIEDRREGFLLSMLVSPASRASLVLGKILGAASLAWIQGMILLVFAPLAGIRIGIEQIVPLATTVFLISFTLTALGFVIAWKFDSTQGYHAVMNLLLLPMWLVSGAVFSVAGATGWMRAIMMANPLTYSLGLLRQQLTPALSAGSPAATMSLAVTAGFGVLLLAASAWMAAQKSSRNAG
ncbi:MAG: ABC transporter permease [Bryobacteraceae bacterium]